MEVVSELTGTVSKLVAEPGQAVQEGDVLLLVESMKMEIPVEAPCSGLLARVHVKQGDAVVEGMVLAAISAAGAR